MVTTMRACWGCLLISWLFLGALCNPSLAESAETSSPLSTYAKGKGWVVVTDPKAKLCSQLNWFGSSSIEVGSDELMGHYSAIFWVDGWNPNRRHIDFEIRNESRLLLAAQARVYGDEKKTWMTMDVDRTFLHDLAESKLLRVKTDLGDIGTYDLSKVGLGFPLLFRCLKEVETGKTRRSSPLSRRMN